MRMKSVAEDRAFQQKRGEIKSGVQDVQRALTVLSVTPCRGSVSPDIIKTMCEGIPGIGALRVDTDRGKIHILYDGTASAIEQVEHTLRMIGLNVRHPEERPQGVSYGHPSASGN